MPLHVKMGKRGRDCWSWWHTTEALTLTKRSRVATTQSAPRRRQLDLTTAAAAVPDTDQAEERRTGALAGEPHSELQMAGVATSARQARSQSSRQLVDLTGGAGDHAGDDADGDADGAAGENDPDGDAGGDAGDNADGTRLRDPPSNPANSPGPTHPPPPPAKPARPSKRARQGELDTLHLELPEEPRHLGIANFNGVSCWFNALLHVMARVPWDWSEDFEAATPLEASIRSALIAVRGAHTRDPRPAITAAEAKALRDDIVRHFDQRRSAAFRLHDELGANRQVDVHEFLHALFTPEAFYPHQRGMEAHGALISVPVKQVIRCGGREQHWLFHGDSSAHYQHELDVVLPPMAGRRPHQLPTADLQALINDSFGPNVRMRALERHICPECNVGRGRRNKEGVRATASVRYILHQTVPDYLFINVRRYEWDEQANECLKNQTPVVVPEELDITVFTNADCSSYTHRRLVLIGAVWHLGSSLQRGHYIACVRPRCGRTFYVYDDDLKPIGIEFKHLSSNLEKCVLLLYRAD